MDTGVLISILFFILAYPFALLQARIGRKIKDWYAGTSRQRAAARAASIEAEYEMLADLRRTGSVNTYLLEQIIRIAHLSLICVAAGATAWFILIRNSIELVSKNDQKAEIVGIVGFSLLYIVAGLDFMWVSRLVVTSLMNSIHVRYFASYKRDTEGRLTKLRGEPVTLPDPRR